MVGSNCEMFLLFGKKLTGGVSTEFSSIEDVEDDFKDPLENLEPVKPSGFKDSDVCSLCIVEWTLRLPAVEKV